MINVLVNFDLAVTQFINGLIPHQRFFDLFFSFLSLQGVSVFIWIILLFLIIIFEERKNPGISERDKKFIFYFTVSLLTTAFLVNIVIKNIVRRPRPPTLAPAVRVARCGNDYSFPSGHASTSFAAAAVLAAFDKKRKYFYYLVAALIGLSRIYLGCHYFLDVLIGGILGYVISRGLGVRQLIHLGKIFLR